MSGGTIAAIIAVVVMIGIIAYAVVQRNALVSGASVTPQAFPSGAPPPVKLGAQAPSFSVDTKGGTLSSASLAGRPYMLEIFATWCPHCQRMTAVLRDIRAKFPSSRFGMVSVTGSGVSMQSTADHLVAENQADVDAFDAQFKITWPVAFDQDLTVAKAWGLIGFPQIFIVDSRGVIRYVNSGEVDRKTLAAAINRVL